MALTATSILAAGPKRPNVIFILADDLGWRDTSFYGSRFYETPNVDRLGKRGMMFTNAYSASPLCSPSRLAIMTGLSASSTTWPRRCPKRSGSSTP
ncbi:MAG: sulfatase-like hydrolase/transferase [Thermoguttaceae bacterium]